MSQASIYWHDYETFGADPRRDRPCQFAGVRTDLELNIIDDPMVIYCRPAPDFLPDPESCRITGITPQLAQEKGISELDFCARILKQFQQPNTCVAGYNSIRFDDEVTRHLLYRCLHDPYEREYKNGNSRWDIIDMVRLAHAVRPEGIRWPVREDGFTSFRLEDLTRENGIAHEGAHDAMSDVLATIELARLVRRSQPRLYDFLFQRRGKHQVRSMLDPEAREPVLHVSAMYPASRGRLAVVIPLLQLAHNANEIVVYDLGEDPQEWLDLSADEIRERLYTPVNDLPEGSRRIGLKTIHINKCPAVAPLSVLDDSACQRWGIDLQRCRDNLLILESAVDLVEKLAAVFTPAPPSDSAQQDPEMMLYSGGFFSDQDKFRMAQLHTMTPAELTGAQPEFDDPRLPEMLFRLRARNFPDTLSEEERMKWKKFCLQALEGEPHAGISRMEFDRKLLELAASGLPAAFIDELKVYANKLTASLLN